MGASQSTDTKPKTIKELDAESSKYLNELKTSGLLDKFILISNTPYILILYDIFQDSNVLDTVEISYFIDKMLPLIKGSQDKLNARLNNSKKGGSNVNTILNDNTILNSRCIQYKFSNWNNIYQKLITNKTKLIRILDRSINNIKQVEIDKKNTKGMIDAFKDSELFQILQNAINAKDPALYIKIYTKICIVLKEKTELSISEISYFMEYILDLFITENFQKVHTSNILSNQYTYANLYHILNKILIKDKILVEELNKV